MGIIRNRKISNDSAASSTSFSDSASPLSEALLFTTMLIIGLPVEVYIKDGSIYSGVFHTASVEKGYGVILKKAKMIKKGTHNANVVKGGLIDTLVVLPGDLVQVVAKEVMLPADVDSGVVGCEDTGVVMDSKFPCSENGTQYPDHEHKVKNHIKRQDGVAGSRGEEDADNHVSNTLVAEPVVDQMESSSKSVNGFQSLLVNVKDSDKMMTKQLSRTLSDKDASPNAKNTNDCHNDSLAVGISPSNANGSEPVIANTLNENHSSSANCSATMPPQGSVVNKVAKESKLNPGAKIFSPSFVNHRAPSPPVVPTMTNLSVAANNYPVHIPAPQPEIGTRAVAGRPSWPVKFIQHGNLTAANGGNGLQYAQPIAGHSVSRVQPIRYGSQYQPIQSGQPFLNPNLQNGMSGRMGQIIGVNQVTHDMIQGVTAAGPFSHAPHSLLMPHPIRIQKLEGYLPAQVPQLSITPPPVANEQYTFPFPGPVPVSQPIFPAMHPVPIIGSNGPFSTKFL